MDEQKIKTQFSARLRDDDIEIINDALPELFPDTDISTLTTREILRRSVEKAVMTIRKTNQSKPEDLKQISYLEDRVMELSSMLDIEKTENLKLKDEINDKTGQMVELQLKIDNLEHSLEQSTGNIKNLEKFKPIENEMRGVVPPLTLNILIAYARKVSAIKKQEIRPFDILISLFNRYITKKEVELPGFPFVISDAEIKKAKAEIDGKKLNE